MLWLENTFAPNLFAKQDSSSSSRLFGHSWLRTCPLSRLIPKFKFIISESAPTKWCELRGNQTSGTIESAAYRVSSMPWLGPLSFSRYVSDSSSKRSFSFFDIQQVESAFIFLTFLRLSDRVLAGSFPRIPYSALFSHLFAESKFKFFSRSV